METIRKYFYNLMTDGNKSLFSCPIKFILWVLSLIYGVILWIRDISYKTGIAKSKRFPDVKIISVGNITVGGTGKTPMVMKLATFLKENGKKAGVLLRGYGQDEHLMLKNTLEGIVVIKGKNRAKSGKEAIDKYRLDTLILDDGFQYRKLKKDFNIILIDSRNPFGNGHLLPRGILRERLSNLKNADAIVITKASDELSLEPLENKLKKISNFEIFHTSHKPIDIYDILSNKEFPLEFIKNKRVAALSSIGDPQYFNKLLRDLGAYIILEFAFLDHHNYKKSEVDKVLSFCKKQNIDTVITTQKDAVKLVNLLEDKTPEVLFLKIKIEFAKDEGHFADRLLRIYNR